METVKNSYKYLGTNKCTQIKWLGSVGLYPALASFKMERHTWWSLDVLEVMNPKYASLHSPSSSGPAPPLLLYTGCILAARIKFGNMIITHSKSQVSILAKTWCITGSFQSHTWRSSDCNGSRIHRFLPGCSMWFAKTAKCCKFPPDKPLLHTTFVYDLFALLTFSHIKKYNFCWWASFGRKWHVSLITRNNLGDKMGYKK